MRGRHDAANPSQAWLATMMQKLQTDTDAAAPAAVAAPNRATAVGTAAAACDAAVADTASASARATALCNEDVRKRIAVEMRLGDAVLHPGRDALLALDLGWFARDRVERIQMPPTASAMHWQAPLSVCAGNAAVDGGAVPVRAAAPAIPCITAQLRSTPCLPVFGTRQRTCSCCTYVVA